MSSSSEGLEKLSSWQQRCVMLRVFSLGTISYVPEGAEVRLRPFGSDNDGASELILEMTLPGFDPHVPSFPLAGAEVRLMTPLSVSEEFPSFDIDRFNVFVLVRLRDKRTLLLAETTA